MTLLEKCNADVFKAILDIKEQYPEMGQALINIFTKHEFWWQIGAFEIFTLVRPFGEIWDGKIHTFYLLFESQPTTKMP